MRQTIAERSPPPRDGSSTAAAASHTHARARRAPPTTRLSRLTSCARRWGRVRRCGCASSWAACQSWSRARPATCAARAETSWSGPRCAAAAEAAAAAAEAAAASRARALPPAPAAGGSGRRSLCSARPPGGGGGSPGGAWEPAFESESSSPPPPHTHTRTQEESCEFGGYFICNGIERIIRMLVQARGLPPLFWGGGGGAPASAWGALWQAGGRSASFGPRPCPCCAPPRPQWPCHCADPVNAPLQNRRHYVMALRRGAYHKRGPSFTDMATLVGLLYYGLCFIVLCLSCFTGGLPALQPMCCSPPASRARLPASPSPPALPHKGTCGPPPPLQVRCVRSDESSLTNRCHYLADGTCVFAITIRRAGVRRGGGRGGGTCLAGPTLR